MDFLKMNLFFLDTDLKLCAEQHVDTHVVKMPTESEQMLAFNIRHLIGDSSSLKLLNGESPTTNSKTILNQRVSKFSKAHFMHPCTVWARESRANTELLIDLAFALGDEWAFRYNRESRLEHLSIQKVQNFIESPDYERFMSKLPNIGLTAMPECMPDEYKLSDVISSYRNYYKLGKSHLHSWKKRGEPQWMKD